MADSPGKRFVCSLSGEDRAWLDAVAEDEGMPAAVMLGVLVRRLRLGRPALMRDAVAAGKSAAHAPLSSPSVLVDQRRSVVNPTSRRDIADPPLAESADESMLSVSEGQDGRLAGVVEAGRYGGFSGSPGASAPPETLAEIGAGAFDGAVEVDADDRSTVAGVEVYANNGAAMPAAVPLLVGERPRYNPGRR